MPTPSSSAPGSGTGRRQRSLAVLPGQGGEVRFRQGADQAVGFQGFQQDADRPRWLLRQSRPATRRSRPAILLEVPAPPRALADTVKAKPPEATQAGAEFDPRRLGCRSRPTGSAGVARHLGETGPAAAPAACRPHSSGSTHGHRHSVGGQLHGLIHRLARRQACPKARCRHWRSAHLDRLAGKDLVQPLAQFGHIGTTCTSTLAISWPSTPRRVIVVRPGARPRT